MYVCKQYIVRCMEGWPSLTLCASCDGENKKKQKKKKKKKAGILISFGEDIMFRESFQSVINKPLVVWQCFWQRQLIKLT